jgi:hypothetical protein
MALEADLKKAKDALQVRPYISPYLGLYLAPA